MKRIIIGVTALLLAAGWAGQAQAWRSFNRWGGGTAHMAGFGTVHQNAFGGWSAHAWGGGAAHGNIYGGAAVYHPPGAWFHPGPYPFHPAPYPYHPPVAVPYYAPGCPGCAVAAGAIAGLATGAVVSAAANSAAASNAYASGYAAGSANAAYVMGANYARLPAGSVMQNVGGATYYQYGNTWFQPAYGANGVYYLVVPQP